MKKNSDQPCLDDAEKRAMALVKEMTRAEKISQMISNSVAIPRLGIPAYEWWTEGLHGIARNGYATVFPQAIGLAASWNRDLVLHVAAATSVEARAKFNLAGGPGRDHARNEGLTLWSPSVNMFRDPRWGRGQETYGEDPYLTGELGIQCVRGLQGDDPDHPRVIAAPKPLAVHSGPESGRYGFDVDVSPHDLEATYTPAFRASIVEGQAWAIMGAYNAIHGTPACASEALLTELLRNCWGFRGFVVSDYDAIRDMTDFHHFRPDYASSAATALKAGLDLNGGTAYLHLSAALERGEIKEDLIDRSLIRLLAARYRLGELHPQKPSPYDRLGSDDIDTPAHRALALNAALQSIVLLKNQNSTLPLKPGTRIAVIGPNADLLQALEANYQGTSVAPITPLQGLRRAFGEDAVSYAQGAPIASNVPIAVPETALRSNGKPGLRGEYFNNAVLAGSPHLVRQDRVINFNWDHVAPAQGMDKNAYSVRWTGELVPPGPGVYALALRVARCFDCGQQHDPARLYIDGELIVAGDACGKLTHPAADDDSIYHDDYILGTALRFDDARPRSIRIELEHQGQDQGIRLDWLVPEAFQFAEVDRAVAAADATVAFVGLSPDVEGEALRIDVLGFDGGDRNDIALPPVQQALLERAKAGGKPLIVVLMSGSAVAVNWANRHAEAILAAWYPGQSGGEAVAQVLTGAYNPGGRLPVTFYRATKDLPPFVSYDMQGRTYRYFKGKPLFPFGFGLSYTAFDYAEPTLSTRLLSAGDSLEVRAVVRNAGERTGDEVVQVYLGYPERPQSPIRALVGFERVTLTPGETREVTFALGPRQLSDVNRAGERAVEAGDYHIFIGGGQPGTGAPGKSTAFSIKGRAPLPR